MDRDPYVYDKYYWKFLLKESNNMYLLPNCLVQFDKFVWYSTTIRGLGY